MTTPWASLAGRIAAIERTLQVDGQFTTTMTAAVGDALGRVRAELEDKVGLIDARLTAVETWLAAADVKSMAKPRVRVRAQGRPL